MQKGLSATPADLSWVVSGYALTFGLILVPSGVFGDMVGRRTAFLVGLAAFTVASGLCGIAPGAAFLVVARLVQGFASGILGPQISGLIQEMFSGAARARAFGYFGATVGLATAVGPLVGGLLIAAGGEDHGWRWVFFVNLPIGVVAFVLALRLIPGCVGAGLSKDARAHRLVRRGAARRVHDLDHAAAGPGAAVEGPRQVAAVVLGVLLILAFAQWERRVARAGKNPAGPARLGAHPLLHPRQPAGPALLRRLHHDLLHLHAVPAERPELQRPGSRPGHDPLRPRLRGERHPRRTPGRQARPAARDPRHRPGDGGDRGGDPGRALGPRPRGGRGDRGAAAGRRRRLRSGHRAEPRAVPVGGPGDARRYRRRRHADRAAPGLRARYRLRRRGLLLARQPRQGFRQRLPGRRRRRDLLRGRRAGGGIADWRSRKTDPDIPETPDSAQAAR